MTASKLIVALGSLLGLALTVHACSDDETDDRRRGGLGASCTQTDDCEAPLACVNQICGGPSTSAAGGNGGGGAGGGDGGSGLGPIDSVGPGENTGSCDACLDTLCASELAACDEPCLRIETCIETQCRSLTFADGEESNCFLNCQNQNPTGITKHQAVFECSFMQGPASCPSCGGYLTTYPPCRQARVEGECAPYAQACAANVSCVEYQACVETCTTASGCIGCGSSATGMEGRALFEDLNRCVSLECISESWLP